SALLDIQQRIEADFESNVRRRSADAETLAEVTELRRIGEVRPDAHHQGIHGDAIDHKLKQDAGTVHAKRWRAGTEVELACAGLDPQAVVDHVLVSADQRHVDLPVRHFVAESLKELLRVLQIADMLRGGDACPGTDTDG